MTTYQVNEAFSTVQGEGFHAGVQAYFIRLQGCTVGCPWCDTKYTWRKGGTRQDVNDIVRRACMTYVRHVVITGGEPTLYDLDALLERLHQKRRYVQLETSGQNALKGQLVPDWITWSPKKNLAFEAPESLKMQVAEVKWVVDEELEQTTVMSLWNWYADRYVLPEEMPYFYFMPEGTPPRPEMVQKALHMIHANPMWRYGDRLQWRIGVR